MPSRYGFQGEFAEQDEETDYVAFELRNYDAVTGRWLSVDPMRQFHSPYIGMGNNPISYIDPDGGYSKFGAWLRNGFSMNGVYESGGEYGFNTQNGDVTTFNYGRTDENTFRSVFEKRAASDLAHQYQYNEIFRADMGLRNGIEPDHFTQLTLGFATVGAVARTASFVSTLEGATVRTGAAEVSNISATTTIYSRGSVLRAPSGGIRVGGKFYEGGQFYPGPRLYYGRGAVPQLQPSAAFIDSAQPWAQRLMNAPAWVRYGVGGGGSAALIYSEYKQFMNGKQP